MNKPDPEFNYAALGKVAAEIYRRRMGDVPDSELIIAGRQTDLPPKHWCMHCEWATIMPDRVMCPLADGSCVKIPDTMNQLDPERFYKTVRKYNLEEAVYA